MGALCRGRLPSRTPTTLGRMTSRAGRASRHAGARCEMYARVPGNVPDGGQLVSASSNWARPKSRNRNEIPPASARRTLTGVNARGGHDHPLVRVRKPFQDLSRRLDRLGVAQLARSHRLAQGLTAHVTRRRCRRALSPSRSRRREAALVPQTDRRLGLALGAMGRLALPRDDLESDVQPVVLVAGQPHRSRTPAPNGAAAVAVQDQFPARKRLCATDTTFGGLAAAVSKSFHTADSVVTVAPDPPRFPMNERESRLRVRLLRGAVTQRPRDATRHAAAPTPWPSAGLACRAARSAAGRPDALLRLLGLIAFAILIVVSLAVGTELPRAEERDAYATT